MSGHRNFDELRWGLLKKQAKAAEELWSDEGHEGDVAWEAFVAAVSPKRIIKLVNRVEALYKENRLLTAQRDDFKKEADFLWGHASVKTKKALGDYVAVVDHE